jgi:hypothetical protein
MFTGKDVVVGYLKSLYPDIKDIVAVNTKENILEYVTCEGEIKEVSYCHDNTDAKHHLNITYNVVNGQYSKIDRWFITNAVSSTLLKNIHHKDPKVKSYWELMMGHELTDDMEVWPRLDDKYYA